MTPSKIFLYFCLSFIGGIFLSSIFQIPQLLMLGFLILGIFLSSVFWNFKKIAVFGLALLFLTAGIWWHQRAELKILNNDLRKYNDQEEKLILIGVVKEEPKIREKNQQLVINIEFLQMAEDSPLPIKGKALVSANRYPEYEYGDKLKITGLLETPPIFEGFNYKDYLKKDGIYSVMSWPEIELVGRDFGNPLMKIIFSFKNKFQETSQRFISPPEVGILEALIFGEETNISKEWKEKLNLTGSRHITAVSGMNITIIASLILTFFLALGFWRNQAFYLSIFLLFLYILMIGAPASAVRAGVMGGLLMTAQYFGRLSVALRAIVFAAFLMLLLNPLLLRLDVGFQLSFLATLGIIYLQPVFSNWLKPLPNPKFFPLKTTLATTLAAQIFTLPILVYNFGYFSLVSPITNILIVPFLAPITILIFIFGVAGMIFWPFGYLLSFPTWLSLSYITKIIDLFSKFPWVSLSLENAHWGWLFVSYLILGLIVWRLKEKEKLKFLKY